MLGDLEREGELAPLFEMKSWEEESILKARFHGKAPDVLFHLTSEGRLYLSDLRQSLNLRSNWTEFFYKPSKTHFFTEYIVNPSDAHFMQDGNSLVVRDYLQLKVWDMRYNARPMFASSVSKAMARGIGKLYENNHIFDKFDLAVSPDSQRAVTGSYNGQFHLMGLDKEKENFEMILEASPSDQPAPETYYESPVLKVDWNPMADGFAVARGSAVYVARYK